MMRWAPQVCPQCAGALYVDYAEVALVCLRCGRTERAPRAPGAAGTAGRSPAGRAAASARTIGLVDVREETRRLIEDVCLPKRYRLVSLEGGVTAHRRPRTFDLLVVESDRAGMAVKLAAELRGRFPAAPVAVVLTYWSESEKDAAASAEFILHAPLRPAEVTNVIQVMEAYGGWLPAPLLASKYRASLAG